MHREQPRARGTVLDGSAGILQPRTIPHAGGEREFETPCRRTPEWTLSQLL